MVALMLEYLGDSTDKPVCWSNVLKDFRANNPIGFFILGNKKRNIKIIRDANRKENKLIQQLQDSAYSLSSFI